MKAVRRWDSKRGPAGNPPPLPSPGHAQSKSRGLDELRSEYKRLHHSEAPRLSRDLLGRAISYRRQEIAHGGLGKATRRKLQTIAKALRSTGRVRSDPKSQPKAGSTACARMARPCTHRHRNGRRI